VAASTLDTISVPAQARAFEEGILVSPPFSCGAGLLIDLLLRLDLRVRPPAGEAWGEGPNGFSLSPALRSSYAMMAQSIAERELFQFSDRKSFMFEHRMDMAALPARARILLVRDPVDAVYSWHRRWGFGDRHVPFDRYLQNISLFPNHLPHGGLVAKPMEVFALFVLFWMLVDENLIIVRFEDLKQNPVREVSRILAAIGAQRSEAEIAEAAHRSSFEMISASSGDRSGWNQQNLRSHVYEWRERLDLAERRALTAAEPIASVCRMLSYECPDSGEVDIFRHDSVVWKVFGENLRKAGARFHAEEAPIDEYFQACHSASTAAAAVTRWVSLNEVNVNGSDVAASEAILTVIKLLASIFRGAPAQPVERLERLVLGLAAVVANGTSQGAFRHLAGPVNFFT
jgi:hypothetical protein